MSELEVRGAAWTPFFPPNPPQERGTRDEGRRASEGGLGRCVGPRKRAANTASASPLPTTTRWCGPDSALLDTQPDFTVRGTASDGSEAVRVCRELRHDVVLMDVQMPAAGSRRPGS